MMSEPKGRSGKKPKYQIADIGGSDLTSEDISTERVLNFLIKGEMGSIEQSSDTASAGANIERPAPSPAEPTSDTSAQSSVRPEDVTSEPPAKKSLNHLFERASSSGGGAPAKDLKLNLSESQPSASVPFPPSIVRRQTVAIEEVTEVERVEVTRRLEANAPRPESQDASLLEAAPKSLSQPLSSGGIETTTQETGAVESAPASSAETSSELSHYLELWKDFYRLNSGEIDALSAMFRMSHDEGRSECYVKMRKLAEISSLDYRYCQKVIRSLERLGWITKLHDYDPVNRLGVLYRVNLKPTVNLHL
jgi:DNA-binding MarR family transcriptional regulator